MQTTVQRHSRLLDMSRATWNLIALRKHSDFFWVVKTEKKSISILHVVDMPFEWTDNLIFFFFITVQFYQTCQIPDETKKILGPKISPPDFQALISPSPEFFREGSMSGSVNVCGWFIYRTIRWILLFLIWQSELRGQHCTRAALHQSDCFEFLKFLLKSCYQKCL